MTLLASTRMPSHRPTLMTRLARWLTAQPTRRQRRNTVDLQTAPESLKRDLGLDRLSFIERRW